MLWGRRSAIILLNGKNKYEGLKGSHYLSSEIKVADPEGLFAHTKVQLSTGRFPSTSSSAGKSQSLLWTTYKDQTRYKDIKHICSNSLFSVKTMICAWFLHHKVGADTVKFCGFSGQSHAVIISEKYDEMPKVHINYLAIRVNYICSWKHMNSACSHSFQHLNHRAFFSLCCLQQQEVHFPVHCLCIVGWFYSPNLKHSGLELLSVETVSGSSVRG